MFPPTRGGSGYLCANSIRKSLGISLRNISISADPRKLRRTFGQNYLDSDTDSIESVSALMGHSSTRTTEKYYARRRNTKAIEAARSTWSCSETVNPPRIESEESSENGQPDSVDEGPEKGNGAGGRIRTGELLRERILSPSPLTRLGNSSIGWGFTGGW